MLLIEGIMVDDNYKTITRVLEYRGSQEWLESTLSNSRIPIQGVKQMQNGMFIKSGVIIWQPDAITEQQVEDDSNGQQPVNQPSDEMTRAIEAAKTVVFRRPGE